MISFLNSGCFSFLWRALTHFGILWCSNITHGGDQGMFYPPSIVINNCIIIIDSILFHPFFVRWFSSANSFLIQSHLISYKLVSFQVISYLDGWLSSSVSFNLIISYLGGWAFSKFGFSDRRVSTVVQDLLDTSPLASSSFRYWNLPYQHMKYIKSEWISDQH